MLMQKAAKQRLVQSHCSVWHKLCGLTLERVPYHPHGCSLEDVLTVWAQWRQVHREAVHLCAALQLSPSSMCLKPLELPAVRCASAAQLLDQLQPLLHSTCSGDSNKLAWPGHPLGAACQQVTCGARSSQVRVSALQDTTVNLFETTIRILGGLLAAFHIDNHSPLWLDRALELGLRMTPALTQSPSGVASAALRQHGPTQLDTMLLPALCVDLDPSELHVWCCPAACVWVT